MPVEPIDIIMMAAERHFFLNAKKSPVTMASPPVTAVPPMVVTIFAVVPRNDPTCEDMNAYTHRSKSILGTVANALRIMLAKAQSDKTFNMRTKSS